MWVQVRHMHIDGHGRQKEMILTVNMDAVVGYTELENGRTRLFLKIGHDIEDHRSAHWMDILNPKEEIDRVMDATVLGAESE